MKHLDWMHVIWHLLAAELYLCILAFIYMFKIHKLNEYLNVKINSWPSFTRIVERRPAVFI